MSVLATASTAIGVTPAPADADIALADAISTAAAALFSARSLLITVDADWASANAALDLAEAVEGAVALPDGDGLASELEAFGQGRVYMTSRREAFARADLILTCGLSAAALGVAESFRRSDTALTSRKLDVADLDAVTGRDLKEKLALLSALASETPAPGFSDEAFRGDREIAGRLKAAKFGVALWEPGALDALEIAALSMLIDKLNRTTRFTSLPLRQGRGWATAQLCLARWGVAPPARWIGGRAVPLSPEEFAAYRVNSDALLSVSPLADPPQSRLELSVSRAGASSTAQQTGAVKIDLPASSAAGIVFDPAADAYVAVTAAPQSRNGAPPVADTLRAILVQVRNAA